MPPTEENENRWNAREVKHTFHFKFSWGVSEEATIFMLVGGIVLVIAGLIYGIIHMNYAKDAEMIKGGFARCKIQGSGMEWVKGEQAKRYDYIYKQVRLLLEDSE